MTDPSKSFAGNPYEPSPAESRGGAALLISLPLGFVSALALAGMLTTLLSLCISVWDPLVKGCRRMN